MPTRRCFNPIGADASGLIGEDPQGIPNNLMPYVSQVAVGKREKLTIFGKDYDTPDGTCRRDFIHVTDLAKGHVKAVEYAMKTTGTEVFNMGTGTPYSVLEIVKAFQDANALKIPYEFGPRRPGDLAECWADAAKAERILGWKAEKNLTDMCQDTWNWQKNKYMKEAYDTNWMSTVGANINEVERIAAEKAGVKYAVALSACTAALHLCVKLAGEKLYGRPAVGHGAVEGKRVFCSDMTFDATLNPVLYEGGIPVFIDTNPETWNMDPAALEKAFEMYPEVKLVACAELYGFPGGIREIKEICEKHGALLIEDAAEAMGATYEGQQCGSFGDYSAISYNGNKIIPWRMPIKPANGPPRPGRQRRGTSTKRWDTTTE